MASHHLSETDSEVPKSIISSSPPQSEYSPCDSEPPLQFMCSFGGQILPRRHNASQLCYVGGNTHILIVDRCTTFSSLLTKLSNLAGNTDITVKYQLVNKDFDELISVTTDDDVESMKIVYHQLIHNAPHGSAQFLRLFLFTKGSSNVFSHTDVQQEEYQYQEVQPLVMEQTFLNLEELQQETIASTDIPLVSGRATGSVARSVSYKILESPDAQEHPELKLNSGESSVPKRSPFELLSAMENLETLWTLLNDKDVHTISLCGYYGTGKSWMVRQIIDRARASNLFETIIWIADDGSKDFVDIYMGLELIRNGLRGAGVTVAGSAEDDIHKALQGREYLLVWDQPYNFNFEDLVPHPKSNGRPCKQLFVGYNMPENYPTDKYVNVLKLPKIEARLVFENQSGIQLDDPEICQIAQSLLKKCNRNLYKILVLAESLRRNLEESSTTLRTIQTLQKVSDQLDQSMNIVKVVFEMLRSKQVRDCFLYFLFYFTSRDRGDPVNVVHLITFWILGGCLDGFNCLADAYKSGQDILLELTDSLLLRRHDNEHVTVGCHIVSQCSDFIKEILHYEVLAILDFQRLTPFYLMDEEWGIRYSKLEDSETKGLLVYGNEARAPHEIPDVLFEKRKNLQILSLQHTGIKSLPSSFSTLESLHVLILRDCSLLEDVSQIRAIPVMEYLDLSGASSLNELPDNFFDNMKYLCHLDLSNTQLKKLPSSFYDLTMLQSLCLQGCSHVQLFLERFSSWCLNDLNYLLLRGCSLIQTMPHPDAFPKIQVLDLSCASAFKEFQGESAETYSNLRKVDLSGTKIIDVHFLSTCFHLQVLLLKNCSKIETVPCLSVEVEILDLSGSISFKKFEDESLGHKLLRLDLSRTRIENLPMFSIGSRLSQLLLRECADLEELPPLEFQKLQVLDLSGSINFKKFNDVSFRKLRRLNTLDVSATQIRELPNISECSHLQQLIFKNCPRLEMLPQLKELTELKVLDLSGSAASRKFQVADMEKMVKLQDLNLSGTQVVKIPSLDEFHDLRSLILRGCLKLEMLPHLEALSRLQVLDLSGSVSFKTFQDQSLGSKYHLQILDLSETQVAELPLLSECSNLCQLLLRDCSKLKKLPPIEKPARLKVVDLSGTKNLDISFLSKCQNLRELSLRGCSNLDAVSFECMHDLEKVDLSGTSIQMLPSCFSKFRNLNQLLLKECLNLKTLPQLESCYNLEVLDISWQRAEESSSGISEWAHSRFLVTMNKNYFWEFDREKDFQRFYVCLCSLKDWGKEKDIYFRNREAVLEDMYYQINHIPLYYQINKFLKICGFQTFPSGAEVVLVNTELLYLEKNDFITRLSDLGAKHVKAMKDCWIESCENMESCFYGEEEIENDVLGGCLQNLWVSKLSNLKCLFRNVVNSKSFTCLKNLYIECCPSLITLFSSHLKLKHLDTLKIKFCDKLENVSGDMVLTEQTFPRLKTLYLWKLPKLNRICTGALPSLEYLAVKRCPKLEKLPFSLNSTSRSLKIRGEKLWWDNLKCEDDTIKFHIGFTELPRFL